MYLINKLLDNNILYAAMCLLVGYGAYKITKKIVKIGLIVALGVFFLPKILMLFGI